jgi:hypothetical protein
MSDDAKLNRLLAEKVREAAGNLVADIRDDISRSLERLNALRVELSDAEIKAMLPAPPPAVPSPGAAVPSASPAALREAVAAVEQGRSQVEVLTPLVEKAVDFAARAAIFVVKQNSILGWKAMGFEAGGLAGADVRKVQLSLKDDTLLKRACETPCIYVGAPERIPGNAALMKQLKGSPTLAGAFPLVTKNRIAAVLYVDNGREGGRFDAEALRVLALAAGMAVDLIGVRPKQLMDLSFVEDLPAGESSMEEMEAAEPALEAEENFELNLDEGMPAEAEAEGATDVEELSFVDEEEFAVREPEPPPPPPRPAPKAPPPSAAKPAPARPAPAPKGFDEELEEAAAEEFKAPAPRAAAPSPRAAAKHAPAAAEEDEEIEFTDTETAAPAPPAAAAMGEEDEEAMRFARLLVSEIKLYNEQKVTAGRKKRDIYERLKEDIDRSLKVYKERVPAHVSKRRDYFYEELVKTLGGGDAAALGKYPHKF